MGDGGGAVDPGARLRAVVALRLFRASPAASNPRNSSASAQSSACNRLHSVGQRCARWLLHTHDRVGAGEFVLTQEFLAEMLGVRRASVRVGPSRAEGSEEVRLEVFRRVRDEG